MKPLLKVINLSLILETIDHQKTLISDINFEIFPNQTFVLLGETGSGKTLTGLSILRLLSSKMFVSKQSQILLNSEDLLLLSEVEMRSIRGKEIAMVFQEPQTSLNPVMTIGDQIKEMLKNRGVFRNKRRQEILNLLKDVQIGDVDRVYRAYPHQLSGGMKQRVMIAMAIANHPKLLIADEPTSSLDVTIQVQILKLLKDLQVKYGMSMLFITHDLKVAEKMADQVAVLQAGKVVECGLARDIFNKPKHPYTQMLLNIGSTIQKSSVPADSKTLLTVSDLKVYFPIKRGILKRTVGYVKAVDDVSFTLKEGETLAVIGESGSGKTTLARAVVSLIRPTEGEINLLDHSLTTLSAKQLRQVRSEIQIIFQDPYSSLNPRFIIKEVLEEGMLALNGSTAKEREEHMDLLLEQVGLLSEHKYRYPHQLSGGQRQRVCIARALAVGPRLLVCDEPTSSLDVSTQAQILDLFVRLQQELEISYLFITHNIDIARAIANRVAVMQAGKIVEYGEVESVFNAPKHPFTRLLLES